jgi:hypothetical protein
MEPRAAAVSFQDEFRIGFFKRTDWYFLLVVAAIFTVYALIVAIMSTFPVPETTDEDIRALQRKVATMVFNIPVERTTPSEKARAAAPVKTPTT